MTLVASIGVLMKPSQQDKIASTFFCNSMKSYWIDSCNKSIAT